jgi:hypothetical protein
MVTICCALTAVPASAKEAVALISNSDTGDIAVNSSGAGPANAGDIYVAGLNRIQRFAQDDNGTPGDPYDDTYPLISVWGADVDGTPAGGTDYEICDVPSDCKAAVPSAGNGTAAGNGSLKAVSGLAVDQDTGNVYVANGNQISIYAGDGTFLRSFGRDAVFSGPDDSGTGYEICVAANGDICQASTEGAAAGEISDARDVAVSQPDGNPATGRAFVADAFGHRVDTFALDGTSPGFFGSSAQFQGTSSNPGQVAVDSRGIVYAADRDNHSEIERYDSTNANGGGVGFLAPIASPPLSVQNSQRKGLEVDPDSDGAGPDTDVLYVLRDGANPESVVQQFGPVNAPGLTAPPTAEDSHHGALVGFEFISGGLGIDYATGRIFVNTSLPPLYAPGQTGTFVLDAAGSIPTASLDSLSDITATSVTLHGTVDPNGPPNVTYRVEYSTDDTNWSRLSDTTVGSQEGPQPIEAVLGVGTVGLEPATHYFVRMVAIKAFTAPVITATLDFTTNPGPPIVETTGAPIHTVSTARLGGRVTPRNSSTTYRFEYGDQGPCDSNPCTATTDKDAGAGSVEELVSEEIEGLQPETTYHYRVVADNGQAGSPFFGQDMTVRTRGTEAPLSHGHFPGPPGSDRAWELVSAPEGGGNPVEGAASISDDGSRVVWGLGGGSPTTDTGGFTQLYSQRTAGGWQATRVFPTRNELVGANWHAPLGRGDLSSFTALNYTISGAFALFRMTVGAPPEMLHGVPNEGEYGYFDLVSDDGSRVLMGTINDDADPAHPVPPKTTNLYDVSTAGSPRLVGYLPGDVVPACGIVNGTPGSTSPYSLSGVGPAREDHWISPDGKLAFFMSQGNDCQSQARVYMRDLSAEETKLISGPAISGPECGSGFIRSTPQAAFFWSKARLVAADTAPSECQNPARDGDIYRYDLGDGSLRCVTCVVPGVGADVQVNGNRPAGEIALSEDGSRAYFTSGSRLLPEADTPGVYRLDIESGALAYVGSFGGEGVGVEDAFTSDGSLLFFSSSDSSLNPLGGGVGNAGTKQLYRYDDEDRSLVCVSCPQDGSAPRGDASPPGGGVGSINMTPLSAGGIFAFSTPTPLAAADQNTAAAGQDPGRGTDAYEWRDGRLLLVSDGLSDWPGRDAAPTVKGMSPSGRDILFTAATQYTPDAVDDFRRLYDARIGGGIEFSKPPPPCPLEVCQGTPKGVPEEAAPGTGFFSGPGNAAAPHSKHQKKRGGKKHRKKAKKHAAKNRTNHHRRAAR